MEKNLLRPQTIEEFQNFETYLVVSTAHMQAVGNVVLEIIADLIKCVKTEHKELYKFQFKRYFKLLEKQYEYQMTLSKGRYVGYRYTFADLNDVISDYIEEPLNNFKTFTLDYFKSKGSPYPDVSVLLYSAMAIIAHMESFRKELKGNIHTWIVTSDTDFERQYIGKIAPNINLVVNFEAIFNALKNIDGFIEYSNINNDALEPLYHSYLGRLHLALRSKKLMDNLVYMLRKKVLSDEDINKKMV